MGLQTLAGATFATALLGAGTVVSANVLTVQQGDTLSEIAQKHHTTVAKIAKDNHIKDINYITTGQKLSVDDKTTHKVTRKATDTNTHYTVVSGDTLSTIAEAYDTTADKIADLNNMSTTDTLQIGQLLTVAGHATPEPTSAVAEPTSTATSNATAPTTVASSAVAEPKSVASSNATAPTLVTSSAVAEPETVASSNATIPTSVTSSAVSEPETVATSTVSEPESVASSAVSEPETIASSAVSEPESVASSAVTEPETVASSAVSEPESVASSAVSEPESESVASSAVSEPETVASSSVATPTAPEQTVATTVDAPVANATTGSLGAGSLTSAQRSAIVNEAVSLSTQNIPYVWGGKTTAGFDCSGLASYVFAQAGVSLPSYTVSEEAYVNTLDVSSPSDVTANAQPGDLLFWGDHGSTWHVAIYIGGGQYVAAPQPGMNVEVENVSPYFMPSFIGRY